MEPRVAGIVGLVALISTSAAAGDQFLTGEAAWPSVVRVEHYSSEIGRYGYEAHNHDGANMAFVIHQYSNAAPAFQIDNTKNNVSIYIRNSENPDTSPGTRGTGAFLMFGGYGKTDPNTSTALGWLGPDMDFHSTDPLLPFKFVDGLSVNGKIVVENRRAVSCKGPPTSNYEVVNGLVVNC